MVKQTHKHTKSSSNHECTHTASSECKTDQPGPRTLNFAASSDEVFVMHAAASFSKSSEKSQEKTVTIQAAQQVDHRRGSRVVHRPCRLQFCRLPIYHVLIFPEVSALISVLLLFWHGTVVVSVNAVLVTSCCINTSHVIQNLLLYMQQYMYYSSTAASIVVMPYN